VTARNAVADHGKPNAYTCAHVMPSCDCEFWDNV